MRLRAHAAPGQPYFAALAARRRGAAPTRVRAEGDWGLEVTGEGGRARVSTAPPFARWRVALATAGGERAWVLGPTGCRPGG